MWSRSLISVIMLSVLALPACASTTKEEQTAEAIPAVIETTPVLSQTQRFAAWKTDFINRAVAKGYDRAMATSLIMPAELRESALKSDSKQPEFTKPVWSYVDGAASAARLNNGRRELSEHGSIFDAIENRYKVPRHILTSIWGLETAYGTNLGDYNPVDALATFAFEGRRMAFGEAQLFALLDILRSKTVDLGQLKSSWAGAMGMTQFIPATFRDYAVDFDGDGNKDLWDNEADALGSAAHYLSRHGWRWGEPVMTEVAVEAGFLEAKLITPGGHRGPKLLIFKNFDVIKKYNNSTSYAMGITVLGEALRGKPAITTPWPRDDKPLSFENKKSMQKKLNALGYDVGGIDGQIGPNTRKAIRAWQKSNRLPADGYIEQKLFAKLIAQP